jgi:signal transduction histidine kinase
MTRSWRLWAVFALCLAVLLGGVGAISAAALRLERSEAEARRQAAVEEDVRLALWRLDSAVAPLIARESARAYIVYAPLYAPERVYSRALAELGEAGVLVPSPLLTDLPEHVLLHFQVGPEGAVTSPQVPVGRARELALRRYTTGARIAEAERLLEALRPALDRRRLLPALSAEPALALAEPPLEADTAQAAPAQAGKAAKAEPLALEKQQAMSKDPKLAKRSAPSKSSVEYSTRARQVVQNVLKFSSREAPEEQREGEPPSSLDPRPRPQRELRPRPPPPRHPAAAEGAMAPIWLGDRLVLLRKVNVGGVEYLQGCLLDWPAIRAWLAGEVADLFPAARLVPAPAWQGSDRARFLAALPARLEPGARAEAAGDGSPLPAILAATWAMVILASAAVLALLLGLQALSERRAAFVSSVTHELRTPLTTFRMYAEMLAEGMVQDETQRQEYLGTLRREALRLGHLVENVLAYGRVERGKAVRRPGPLCLAELLDRQGDRLRERAAAAGMSLRVSVPRDLVLLGEPGALEQILFNLVDNACKYASPAVDRTIELSAAREGRRIAVRVRDHGPGVSREDRKRLFVPFGRSAARAAGAAPGVGLGLALCRTLARSLGGSIALERVDGPGAAFVVRLRAA